MYTAFRAACQSQDRRVVWILDTGDGTGEGEIKIQTRIKAKTGEARGMEDAVSLETPSVQVQVTSQDSVSSTLGCASRVSISHGQRPGQDSGLDVGKPVYFYCALLDLTRSPRRMLNIGGNLWQPLALNIGPRWQCIATQAMLSCGCTEYCYNCCPIPMTSPRSFTTTHR